MTDRATRERAALDIVNRLPEWWGVGPATFHPDTADGRSPRSGGRVAAYVRRRRSRAEARTSQPQWPTLRILLDDRQRAQKLAAIERRDRAVFLDGAEAQSHAMRWTEWT